MYTKKIIVRKFVRDLIGQILCGKSKDGHKFEFRYMVFNSLELNLDEIENKLTDYICDNSDDLIEYSLDNNEEKRKEWFDKINTYLPILKSMHQNSTSFVYDLIEDLCNKI